MAHSSIQLSSNHTSNKDTYYTVEETTEGLGVELMSFSVGEVEVDELLDYAFPEVELPAALDDMLYGASNLKPKPVKKKA